MKYIKYISICTMVVLSTWSCKKFIELDPPRTELVRSTVFTNDATANAAMSDVYYGLKNSGWASGNVNSISFVTTYSSDEQINYGTSVNQEFNDNQLSPDNTKILQIWSGLYETIYKSNSIIEGVANSSTLSAQFKSRLEGEAKFLRAFCHFYLVNLFGEVPLVITTDYKVNSTKSKNSINEIYQYIINDLKDAQLILPEDYFFANNERVRVNKFAATAMLARVYLYTEKWAEAESEATKVIINTPLYSLNTNLNEVFFANNSEAIFQLWSDLRPNERSAFRVVEDPPTNGALRNSFATTFEPGDQRYFRWVNLFEGYYNARKYKTNQDVTPLEYTTILRLAEQYLIRAEARIQQNKIVEGISDINFLRSRATDKSLAINDPNRLSVVSSTLSKADALLKVEYERKAELFTEWGHRWLDLKRTGRANTILPPLKGDKWQATDMLYPIPTYQILNSNLTQNSGY